LMEFNHREMALLLETDVRTVERKVKRIRDAWQSDFEWELSLGLRHSVRGIEVAAPRLATA